MLRILGSRKRFCDGLTRRELLQIGGLSMMGLGLGELAKLQAAPPADGQIGTLKSFGKAKSVILLFLYGGASQLETFDTKPDAPLEIRGQLKSISTSIPGYAICEGLPNVAQVMDRTTIVRSMTHPYPIHGTAFSVTSTPTLDGAMQNNPSDPRHWPFIGSVVGKTDRIAGEVVNTPVSPQDILATTYYQLGIDPHTLIEDRSGRPLPVGGDGRVLTEVVA